MRAFEGIASSVGHVTENLQASPNDLMPTMQQDLLQAIVTIATSIDLNQTGSNEAQFLTPNIAARVSLLL